MEDRLLRPREAAELLNVKPSTIVQWCRSGRLRCVKVGREWRVYESEARAAIRAVGREK
jgi:excisionase family DNA binding protein